MKTLLQDPLKMFEDLSAVLTGFSQSEIKATGQLEIYYKAAESELGEEFFHDLLVSFQYFNIQNPDKLSNDEKVYIQELIDSEIYKLAISQLRHMWYLGAWVNVTYSNEEQKTPSKRQLEDLLEDAV